MTEDHKDPAGRPKDGPERGPFSSRSLRSGVLYAILLVLLVLTLQRLFVPKVYEATYDEFLTHLKAGHVTEITLGSDSHHGKMEIPRGASPESKDTIPAGEAAPGEAAPAGATKEAPAREQERTGEKDDAAKLALQVMGGQLPKEGKFDFFVNAADDGDLVGELWEAHKKYGTQFKQGPSEGLWASLFMFLAPFLLVLGVFYLMMRQSGQVGRAALSFGKTRAKLYAEKVQSVTFDDVAGCDEAKEELREVVDFLKNPKKYQRLGGRMPKGILLVGPPGTGKTLMARAVAGESKTPFFSLSGSDFVEMFVGVGAARVRDLFQQAKHRAPCIVFVDELDAVGRHRGAGLGGGHDEREQTLNQLLVEMDGFDTTQGVIFLAATNRPDVLDPALLRPGRFDRQVVIDAPNFNGRKAILMVHARDKPFAKDIDFGVLAGSTPGFTGADLANVINEAALLAARRGLMEIGKPELEEAVERVTMGPERKSRRLGEEARRRVAYHEAGHALVAALSKNADPVRKISIIPRGQAAGYTALSPTDDQLLITRRTLIDRLKVVLAGRAAEQIVFGEVSTGAQDDLSRASNIVRSMVCRYGMSDKIGPVVYGQDHGQVFLGRDFMTQGERNYSETTAREIDSEVRRIIEEASDDARHVLEERRVCLDHLAQTLLEREVVQGNELDQLIRKELGGAGDAAAGGPPPLPAKKADDAAPPPSTAPAAAGDAGTTPAAG